MTQTSQKNVLFVITKANWGGAQRYVYDLALAAKDAGHQVELICGSEGNTLVEKLSAHYISTTRIAALKNTTSPRALRAATRALEKAFLRMKPDVVHLNSSIAGIAGARAARRTGVARILFTAHGWAHNEDRPLPIRGAILLLHWWTILLCHHTIAVSASVARQVTWLPGVRRKISVIPLGLADQEPHDRNSARQFLEEVTGAHLADTFLVGTIAELHPIKDYPTALAAFAQFHAHTPQSAYIIIGEGAARTHLEEVARDLGIVNSVHFTGFVENAAAYAAALDTFLLTSRSEAFGYAIAEAGRAGVAVVASRVGGIPEIIPDERYGILCAHGDVDAVADALTTLADDSSLRTSLGAALRTRVRETFSLERMVARTLPQYED